MNSELRSVIQDAMRIVAESADSIKAGCAIDDEWPDAEDKEVYDDQVAVLERLKAALAAPAAVAPAVDAQPISLTFIVDPKQSIDEVLPADRRWVIANAVGLIAGYRNCGASETQETMQKIVDYLRAALSARASDAAPIYQLKLATGDWRDQDESAYRYNAKHCPDDVRIVYTHPASEPKAAISQARIDGIAIDAGLCCIDGFGQTVRTSFANIDDVRAFARALLRESEQSHAGPLSSEV
jgi:hypothetical protein